MMMKNPVALALALLLLTPSVFAQEIVTLTVAETKPANTNYHVASFSMDVDAGMLAITLKGVDEIAYPPVQCIYASNTTPTGATLILGLNKANLSTAYAANATTGSLKQRIFHRLVVMGEAPAVCNGKTLTGTLAGTVP
jgi:hypothetical protein